MTRAAELEHLLGAALPDVTLPSTDGRVVALPALGAPRTVLYVYPMTGRPGEALPPGWDAIPGARGCTAEACSFRDHHDELAALGVDVLGLSAQTTEDQLEAAARLHLPFPLVSDQAFVLADALGLPTFTTPNGRRFYVRLTLIVSGGSIESVLQPVSPGAHAEEIVAWLRATPRR